MKTVETGREGDNDGLAHAGGGRKPRPCLGWLGIVGGCLALQSALAQQAMVPGQGLYVQNLGEPVPDSVAASMGYPPLNYSPEQADAPPGSSADAPPPRRRDAYAGTAIGPSPRQPTRPTYPQAGGYATTPPAGGYAPQPWAGQTAAPEPPASSYGHPPAAAGYAPATSGYGYGYGGASGPVPQGSQPPATGWQTPPAARQGYGTAPAFPGSGQPSGLPATYGVP